MKRIFASAALATALMISSAHAAVMVSNPGPLSSFNFSTIVFNGTSGDIQSVTFDLTGTAAPLVFGGISALNVSGLGGGTATLFGAADDSVFGFNFTGFNPFETFSFSWDPDTAGNSNYGATVDEFAGADVSASVLFGTATVVYTGGMQVVGPDVSSFLTPPSNPTSVPEPGTLALLGLGLSGLGLVRRKRAA